MSSHAAPAGPAWRRSPALTGLGLRFWIILSLAFVIALQMPLIWHRAINWDEFFHYSEVEDLARGALTNPLQTIHTRLFRWTVDLPGSTIDHIIVIRGFMFACLLAAAAAVAGVAARFTSRDIGLACALLYLAAGFVIQHGSSYRADPVVAALLMGSLWAMLRPKFDNTTAILSGVLLGLGAIVTIKFVLYAPAFAGIAWLRWSEARFSRAVALRLVAIGAVAAVTFAVAYAWHANGLGPQSDVEAGGMAKRSAGKMFIFGTPPYWPFIVKAALLSPLQALVIGLTPLAIARSSLSRPEKFALAGFFVPVLCLLFYHNTAPYFYVYMLAPVLVAGSVAVARLSGRFGLPLLLMVACGCALAVRLAEPNEHMARQRAIVDAAHEIFPQPVAYFDVGGFLGDFPKVNGFLTPWGVEVYRAGASPAIRATMDRRAVPLVVDDQGMFTHALATQESSRIFLPDDLRALRESYVQFWGPLWVAGKRVAPGATTAWEVMVPGPYTVHGAGLTIDGKAVAPGAILPLDRGTHQIGNTGQQDALLVWGNRLRRPSAPPPEEPYFTDF